MQHTISLLLFLANCFILVHFQITTFKFLISEMPQPTVTKQFRNPWALSSTLTVLGMLTNLDPQVSKSLNYLDLDI